MSARVLPMSRWIRGYRPRWLVADVLAGFAVFGTSRNLFVGPSSTVAMLAASAVAPVAVASAAHAYAWVVRSLEQDGALEALTDGRVHSSGRSAVDTLRGQSTT